jgi:hypothetical protein
MKYSNWAKSLFKDFSFDFLKGVGTGGMLSDVYDKYEGPAIPKRKGIDESFGQDSYQASSKGFEWLKGFGQTAKKYYGIAEKYALKPLMKGFEWLPETVKEDITRGIRGENPSDYYESLKELAKRQRSTSVDLGTGSSRAFTAQRVQGAVGKAQQAYGQNSFAMELLKKASSKQSIAAQIAKNQGNIYYGGGRTLINLNQVGAIRPFRGKTKLT